MKLIFPIVCLAVISGLLYECQGRRVGISPSSSAPNHNSQIEGTMVTEKSIKGEAGKEIIPCKDDEIKCSGAMLKSNISGVNNTKSHELFPDVHRNQYNQPGNYDDEGRRMGISPSSSAPNHDSQKEGTMVTEKSIKGEAGKEIIPCKDDEIKCSGAMLKSNISGVNNTKSHELFPDVHRNQYNQPGNYDVEGRRMGISPSSSAPNHDSQKEGTMVTEKSIKGEAGKEIIPSKDDEIKCSGAMLKSNISGVNNTKSHELFPDVHRNQYNQPGNYDDEGRRMGISPSSSAPNHDSQKEGTMVTEKSIKGEAGKEIIPCKDVEIKCSGVMLKSNISGVNNTKSHELFPDVHRNQYNQPGNYDDEGRRMGISPSSSAPNHDSQKEGTMVTEKSIKGEAGKEIIPCKDDEIKCSDAMLKSNISGVNNTKSHELFPDVHRNQYNQPGNYDDEGRRMGISPSSSAPNHDSQKEGTMVTEKSIKDEAGKEIIPCKDDEIKCSGAMLKSNISGVNNTKSHELFPDVHRNQYNQPGNYDDEGRRMGISPSSSAPNHDSQKEGTMVTEKSIKGEAGKEIIPCKDDEIKCSGAMLKSNISGVNNTKSHELFPDVHRNQYNQPGNYDDEGRRMGISPSSSAPNHNSQKEGTMVTEKSIKGEAGKEIIPCKDDEIKCSGAMLKSNISGVNNTKSHKLFPDVHRNQYNQPGNYDDEGHH